MSRADNSAFSRLRVEVRRLVAAIPRGRFTTYGTLAKRLGANPRHVASVLARLDGADSAAMPWHRVVAAEGRLSPNLDAALRAEQRSRLEAEGLRFDARDFIVDPDRFFHAAGPPREIGG